MTSTRNPNDIDALLEPQNLVVLDVALNLGCDVYHQLMDKHGSLNGIHKELKQRVKDPERLYMLWCAVCETHDSIYPEDDGFDSFFARLSSQPVETEQVIHNTYRIRYSIDGLDRTLTDDVSVNAMSSEHPDEIMEQALVVFRARQDDIDGDGDQIVVKEITLVRSKEGCL